MVDCATYLQEYAGAGLRIHPLYQCTDGRCACKLGEICQSKGKHPRVKAWQEYATADMSVISGWWKQWPGSNIGIATGPESGVVVVDADSLEDLATLELLFGPLPRDLTVRTGRGGMHIYMRHPGFKIKSRSKIAAFGNTYAVDVKGDGGYVVAPPGENGNGPYTQNTGSFSSTIIPAIPEAWMPLLIDADASVLFGVPKKERKQRTVRADRTAEQTEEAEIVPQGSRNDYLFRELSSQRTKGKTADELQAIAEIMNNSRCVPPLSPDEVRLIVNSVCKYEPGEMPEAWKPGTYPYRMTDVGNAEMLAARLRGIFLHVPERSKKSAPVWLYYNGKFWEQDRRGGITQSVIKCFREAWKMAFQITDDEVRVKVLKWLTECEKIARIDAAVRLLKDMPGMTRPLTDFDSNDILLNTQNGVVDLKTGTLREHRPDDLMTRCCSVGYMPGMRSNLWEQFLSEIFMGDQELISYMQNLIGYCLTGRITEESLYIFKGSGGNGKSKLVETLKHIMGPYCVTSSPETLMAKNFDKIPTDVARLQGARLILMSEPDPGQKFSDNALKSLTGGDTIVARFLFGDEFEFAMKGKFLLLTNHEIRVVGTDNGMWRRLVTIPFDYQVPENKRDYNLQAKLYMESEAVLSWAIEGCKKYFSDGLKVTKQMENARNQYKNSQDAVGQFLSDACTEGKGDRALKGSVYNAYRDWCRENGEFQMTQRAFSQRLTEKAFVEARGSAGERYWAGIRLIYPFSYQAKV